MIDKVLKSGLARPKTSVIYSFGGSPVFGARCYIAVNPKQTWKFKDYGKFIELSRDKLHVRMSASKEDFGTNWIIKEEN